MASKKNIENTPSGAGDSFKRIGLSLRDARRLQRQSLKEVSEQLRISVDYLSKLENGAFYDLPAPAYVNGFLRSYAQYLGLVPDALVARYAVLATSEDTKPCHKMPMTTRPPQRSAPAIASMLVVFAAVAYGSWFWVKGGSENSAISIIATNEIEKPLKRDEILILDAPIDEYAKASSEGMAAQTKGSENPAGVIVTARDFNGKLALKNSTASAGTEILQDKVKLKTANSQKMNSESTTVSKSIFSDNNFNASLDAGTSARPDQFAETQILVEPYSNSKKLQTSSTAVANLRDPTQEIIIRAVASSWVEIVQDNGEEVLAKLMQAGDVYVVESDTRLYLSTGNAGGLTIVIGGDDPITMGGVGEIVRDLPLVTDKLRKVL